MRIRWEHLLLAPILALVSCPSRTILAASDLPASTLFGTTEPLPYALHGKVYYLPDITRKLPDFESLKSVGDLYTYTLQIKPQIFSGEYPGPLGREAWFGIDYSGKFWIKQAGIFGFFLRSDDGAKLYIDETAIIDDDGVHEGRSIKAGQVKLAQGLHRIRVAYFQGPPTSVALQLAVKPPGEDVQIFDMRNFSPPDGADEPSLQPRPKYRGSRMKIGASLQFFRYELGHAGSYCFAEIATKGKSQRCANFAHPLRSQLSYPPSESALRNSDRIVQVHRAGGFHAIFLVQDHFGWHAANRRRDRRNRDGGQVTDSVVAREHNHRSCLVRWGKIAKPDIAASYSSGHAATASHIWASARS